MINWFANPVYTFVPDPDQPNRIRNTMISTQVCQLLFAFDIRASIDYVHYKYEYRYGSEQIAKSEVIFWEQRKKNKKDTQDIDKLEENWPGFSYFDQS